jgi:hypothetical protein
MSTIFPYQILREATPAAIARDPKALQQAGRYLKDLAEHAAQRGDRFFPPLRENVPLDTLVAPTVRVTDDGLRARVYREQDTGATLIDVFEGHGIEQHVRTIEIGRDGKPFGKVVDRSLGDDAMSVRGISEEDKEIIAAAAVGSLSTGGRVYPGYSVQDLYGGKNPFKQ